MARDVQLEVMRLLLDTGEDLAVREIARRLDLPSGHVFYHLKRLVERGVLIRERVGDRIFYTPQPLFTEGVEETLDKLNAILKLIGEYDADKVAECIGLFLKCFNTL